MGRTLQKYRHIVLRELPAWAERELPGLKPRDNFEYSLRIPIPLPSGKNVNVEVGVEVWVRMQVNRPIQVSGILPSGNRLEPEVRRALGEKLPKLAATCADERFLMLDQPTYSDSDIGLLEIIRSVSTDFPLLVEIQGIVFAKTCLLGEKTVYFSVWDVKAGLWSDYLRATIAE
jgi:hypothetical protein